MGFMTDIIAAWKAARRPPSEVDTRYTAATVRVSDTTEGRYNSLNPKDFGRVARAVTGSIWNAASIVARSAASGQIKLYRPVRGSSRGKRIGKAAVEFLRGGCAIKPHPKAMGYANQAEDVEEVLVHPALDLLNNPDPITTSAEFFQALYWFREVAGAAYIWTGGEKPQGLYLLMPQYTRPLIDKRLGLTGYHYGRSESDTIIIPMEEVVASRWAVDPFNPYLGISWVDSVAAYSDMENAAITAEVHRWRNSAQPGMIVKAPNEYNPDQMLQLAEAFNRKGGPFNAGRTTFVRGDIEVVQPNSKPHELNYERGLAQCEAAIYRHAGVPDPIWKMNDAIQSNAAQGSIQWKGEIYNRQKAVASDLTEWLLPMFGVEPGEMWFAYENPVQEDVTAAATRMLGAFTAGCVTVNEVRAVLGLDPVDDSSNTMGRPAPMFPAMPPKPEMEDEDDEDETEDQQASTGGGNADDSRVDDSGDSGDGADAESGDDDADPEDQGDAAKARGKGQSQLKADDGHKPTGGMIEEAKRGLDWREEFGRGGTAIGVARARDISNGKNLSTDTVYRMASYFARHEVDKQGQGWNKGEDGYPSAGRIAWALWGGDAGRTWAEAIVAREDDAEKSITVGRWEWSGKCGCGKRHARKADPTDESIEARIFRAVRTWAEDALKRGVNAIGPDGSFDISALSSSELEGLLKTSIAEAFRAGAVATTAQYSPGTEPLTSEAARQYIAQYNFDLVSGVTETMANQMRTTIDAGLEQGKTINEIQQELTDKIPEVSLNRAEVIARTETSRAYQHGQLRQADELGFDSKEWILSGNPCGLCEGADRALKGKTVPIGQPFFKAGDTIAGTDGKVYVMARPVMAATDIHPQCQCVGVPMVTEESQ